MISFQQLCELLTHNQRHAWFEFDPKLIQYLSHDDLMLVHIDLTHGICRLWYPAYKYKQDHFHRTRSKDSGPLLTKESSIDKRVKKILSIDVDKLMKQAMMKAILGKK